jgi:hypothetical protein
VGRDWSGMAEPSTFGICSVLTYRCAPRWVLSRLRS